MKLHEAQKKSVNRRVWLILPALFTPPTVVGIVLFYQESSWLSVVTYALLAGIVGATVIELLVNLTPIKNWIDEPYRQVEK